MISLVSNPFDFTNGATHGNGFNVSDVPDNFKAQVRFNLRCFNYLVYPDSSLLFLHRPIAKTIGQERSLVSVGFGCL